MTGNKQSLEDFLCLTQLSSDGLGDYPGKAFPGSTNSLFEWLVDHPTLDRDWSLF
jgi:hypothetical protein